MTSAKMRILYVDDEADIREIVEFALADEPDLELRLCDSGGAALAVLDEYRPDLVLLDVMMPGMDGPETLRRLRERDSGRTLPVIFVTAKIQAHEIGQLKALGAQGVISKPFDPMALPGKLRALFAGTSPGNGPKRDTSQLGEIRAAYGAQLGSRLDQLQAALSRVGEPDAGADAALDLHHKAHTLAGSAGTFGYHRLGETARRMEGALAPQAKGATDLGPARRSQLAALLEDMRALAAAGPDEVPVDAQPGGGARVPADAESRRIVLVEDDALLAQEIAAQLQVFGWETDVYASMSQASAALDETAPAAAMIIDVILPEGPLAGAELMQRLQAREAKHIPHVLISVRWDWAARVAAARAGTDAYLPKPVDLAVLAEQLDRITHRAVSEPFRVLIVDDDRLLASHYAQVLADAGMESRAITDPEKLLEAMVEHRPELILMDLYMPGCSGIEAARVLRQDEKFVSIPIVFLSTETALAQQQRAMQTGADEFLQKPIADADLVLAVRMRAERFRSIAALIRQDGLTGLLNHAAFKLRLEAELDRSARGAPAPALAILDIDHFKRVNDTHGHPMGDRVLRSLAQMLQRRLRKSDVAGRYGGEEFAILLPTTGPEDAASIVDELREHFSRLRFMSQQGEFGCTFSAGVADGTAVQSVETLVRAADEALYRAKRGGRNRVQTADTGS